MKPLRELSYSWLVATPLLSTKEATIRHHQMSLPSLTPLSNLDMNSSIKIQTITSWSLTRRLKRKSYTNYWALVSSIAIEKDKAAFSRRRMERYSWCAKELTLSSKSSWVPNLATVEYTAGQKSMWKTMLKRDLEPSIWPKEKLARSSTMSGSKRKMKLNNL